MVYISRSFSKRFLVLLAVALIIMLLIELNVQPVSNGNIYKEATRHDGEVQVREQGEDSLKRAPVEYDETPGLPVRDVINQIKQPDREIQLARVINSDSIEAQKGQDQNILQNHTLEAVNHHSISTICSPKYDVSFIKIHKTGSGEIHNALLRLALHHNLTVALPYCQRAGFQRYQIFPAVAEHRYIFNKPSLEDRHGYNLFFDHAVYDRNAQLNYMAPNTLFYTQIRSPFSQAMSSFEHFHGVQKMNYLRGKECPFCSFISSGKEEHYFRGIKKDNCWDFNHAAPVTRNFQAFTLGYMNANENNITEFKSYLERLEKELFHVSLLEHSDESNLLLKRKMCWHISDVLHIHIHKTKHKMNISSIAEGILKEAQNKHRELSKLDYMLYEFFEEKLLNELQQQPADFSGELEEYKTINSQFSELCDKMCKDFNGVNPSDIDRIRRMLQNGIDIPSSSFNSNFRMTYADCLIQMSLEKVNKVVLKVQQYPDGCKNVTKAAEFGLTPDDCDFKNHVYPGYHIKFFKPQFLNTDACLSNSYQHFIKHY